MEIRCATQTGGSIQFNKKQGAWASYAVAGVSGQPIPEILYAGATLPNRRQVRFFLNRETGLIMVDVVNAKGTSGNEVLRINANEVPI